MTGIVPTAAANQTTERNTREEPIVRRFLLSLLLVLIPVTLSASQDAAAALDEARAHLAKKRYSEAATLLEPAVASAETIADPAIRSQALAAVHFYASVAYSGAHDDAKAETHLREYLRLTPNARAVDPAKYDKRFVALFESLTSEGDADPGFETYYPGFATLEVPETTTPVDAFGPNPALLILGSRAEQHDFRELTQAADREKFIEEFWKRRDATPETPENEFRTTFLRRVAFAEKNFATRDVLGPMSDRGKVFILLGEPSFVRRRPITRHDAIVVADNALVNGTIEQWVYGRDQLPMKLAKERVMYRFVTQEGIGEAVLQKQEDAFAMQALAVAAKPPKR
jgi:GWxTD domain-containing protein